MVITSTTCGSCISELKAMDWILVDPGGEVPSRFVAPTVPVMIMMARKGTSVSAKKDSQLETKA